MSATHVIAGDESVLQKNTVAGASAERAIKGRPSRRRCANTDNRLAFGKHGNMGCFGVRFLPKLWR